MSAIGQTGTFRHPPHPLPSYVNDTPTAWEEVSPHEDSQRSTANKTGELYCSKCRQPINDLPRILSPTTNLLFYDTVESNYQGTITEIKTPLKFAQEMLKRLGDNISLTSLLQYYLDYQASVTATLLTSTSQVWSGEQYDMTTNRSLRGKLPLVPNRLNAEWNGALYETDVDAPHAEPSLWNQELYNTDASKTDDPRIKIFPCGHIYHHHCVADMSDCSYASTCKKAAELFFHRVLVLNFNPDLLPGTQAELLDGLGFSTPSLATRCVSNLRARLWGSGSITNLSDWARFRGRRALVLCAAAATVVVPVLMTVLSKASATQGGAEEGSPEGATVAAGMLNATVSSVANTVSTLGITSASAANIANATMTVFGITNATATVSNILNATRTAFDIINTTFAPSNTAVIITPQNTQPTIATQPQPMTTPAAVQLSFTAAVSYVVGANPFGIATADFNRDGNPDLAVTNFNSDDVSVLLGVGDGTFQTAVNYGTETNPIGLTAHDFNRDGKSDLVATNYGSNTVSVLLGVGDGTFQTGASYGAGSSPQGIVAGDFTGDGKLDLAVTNWASNNFFVFLGAGDGTFQATGNYGIGSGPEEIASGDFNRDGKLDLAATCDSNNVAVFLGNGNGTFQGARDYATGPVPYGITSADFNSDGKLDLVVTNYGSNTVSVLLGVGNGTFQAAASYGVNSSPRKVSSADFNSDGKPDLAIINTASDNVSILLGNGDGTFQAAVNYGVGSRPVGIAAGDFNKDGKPDLAMTDYGTTDVSVLLNSATIKVPATLFGAGVGYSVGLYPYGVVTGDFNRDGLLDMAITNYGSNDLSILLGKGDGTFRSAVNYGIGINPIADGVNPTAIVADDFNRDGKLDLAIIDGVLTHVYVLLGTGNGSLQATANYQVGSLPPSSAHNGGVNSLPVGISSADFNGDGKPDLALASPYANTVSILLGNGDGTFQAALQHSIGAQSGSVTVGDFNRDSKADLAVANLDANNVYVLLGNGDGTFHPAVGYTVGSQPWGIATGDFDGDGKLDLAVVNLISQTVSILLGNGNGIFQPAVNYAVDAPLKIAIGDFNEDDKPDLAISQINTHISILLGNGNGTFQPAVNYEIGSSPETIAAGDFNGDGKPDLAVSDLNANNVTVLLNSG